MSSLLVPDVTTLYDEDRLAVLAVSTEIPAWAKCGRCTNKARVVVVSAPDGSKYVDTFVRPRWNEEPRAALVSTKWACPMACAMCRQGMYVRRMIRVSFSDKLCADACTHASSDVCSCKCGGMNHGIEAR